MGRARWTGLAAALAGLVLHGCADSPPEPVERTPRVLFPTAWNDMPRMVQAFADPAGERMEVVLGRRCHRPLPVSQFAT